VRILRSRERMKRNFIATLFFSQGVPMLLGGDEMGRTQDGNNNAYCQDNEISWFNWDVTEAEQELRTFVRDVIEISKNNPILRQRAFFTGQPVAGYETKDVSWVRADGKEMTEGDWANASIQSVGMLLFGPAADELDNRGRSRSAESVLFLLNASSKSFTFTLPSMELPGVWEEVLNTSRPGPWTRSVRTDAVNLNAHSTILLRHTERPQQ
jgi:glycogen operon protein